MTTNNSWNSTNPAGVVSGGTGLATLTTAYGVVCAGTTATGPLQNAGAGLAGQVLKSGGASALPSFQAPTSAIWNDTVSTPVTMVAGNGYISDDGASQVTFTTPATAAVGDEFTVVGKGSGLYIIAVATGQAIKFGSSTTTTTTGTLTSTNANDVVKLVCTTANTTFTVLHAVGNLTVS